LRQPLHEQLFHEGQCTGAPPYGGTIDRGPDAEGHRLARVGTVFLDDQRVREIALTERLGELPQRGFVGHRERDDDRRRVAGRLGRGVGGLGDLRTLGEVCPDDRVENLGRRGAGRSRRAFAFTVDALASR
jgi:hypothetical protein